MSNFKKQELVLEDGHFSTGNGGISVRIVETQWVPTVAGSGAGIGSSPEYTMETEMSHYGHTLKTSTPLIDPNSTQEIIDMLGRALNHMLYRGVPARQSTISQRVVSGIPIVEMVEAP